MKVICHLDYCAEYTGSKGKTLISFEKGKTYDTITEYDDCYLFAIDLDFYLMSSKDNIIIELSDKFYCYKRKSRYCYRNFSFVSRA
jgi:hypothetical protein